MYIFKIKGSREQQSASRAHARVSSTQAKCRTASMVPVPEKSVAKLNFRPLPRYDCFNFLA